MKQSWITGIAVRGDGRGRELGFPTANIELRDSEHVPAEGIYACWAILRGEVKKGVLHVGPRPTFPRAASTIELHLLEFPDEDLYGETFSILVLEPKLRSVEKFDTINELITAIADDCTRAKALLTHPPDSP